MTKAEEREEILRAMKDFKKDVTVLIEADESDDFYTDQSMHDGEMRVIRDYHHRDGSVGPRFY